MGGGSRGPSPARPQAAAEARRAPDAGAARPGGDFRRLELPARVLGGGRRHGVGARGRLSGRRQGPPGAPRHLRARRPRDPRRRARQRNARRRLLDAARAVARGRPGAGRACRDPGGRLHGLVRRRQGARRRRGAARSSRSPSSPRWARPTPCSCCRTRSPRAARRSRRRSRPRSRSAPASSAPTPGSRSWPTRPRPSSRGSALYSASLRPERWPTPASSARTTRRSRTWARSRA